MGIKKETQPEMLQFPKDMGLRPFIWANDGITKNIKIMFPLTKTHLRREKWGLVVVIVCWELMIMWLTLEGLRHDFGLMAMKGNISERILPVYLSKQTGLHVVHLVCHTNPGASAKVLLFVLRVEWSS